MVELSPPNTIVLNSNNPEHLHNLNASRHLSACTFKDIMSSITAQPGDDQYSIVTKSICEAGMTHGGELSLQAPDS